MRLRFGTIPISPTQGLGSWTARASARNVSFFDYDLDETDLYGDLLWEAPDDVDEV